MFIRKRERKLKDGELSVTYQAIETFTQDGKLARKVISLQEYPTPQRALEFAQLNLETCRKCMEWPVDQYREIRYSAKYSSLVLVELPIKVAEKRRLVWIKSFEKQRARVKELQELVSKYG